MARGKAQVRARDGGTTTVELKTNSVFNPNASVHTYAPSIKARKHEADISRLRGAGVKRSGAATSDSGDYDGVYRGKKAFNDGASGHSSKQNEMMRRRRGPKTFNTGQMTRDLKDKELQRKIREGSKPHTPTAAVADEVVHDQKNLFGQKDRQRMAKTTFAKDFLIPPFSLLDSYSYDWKERHAAWLETADHFLAPTLYDARQGAWRNKKREGPVMGLKSEDGRVDEDIESDSKYEAWGTGVSIFDPVLCELMYSWFCPVGGQVVDPFAGGSVRGVIASLLRRPYWGCDLSGEQIEANREQADDIGLTDPIPVWVAGESSKALRKAPDADYIFTCPPYGNLEVYSDNPDDLSNMPWKDFREGYAKVISEAANALNPDRFATFVVSNFRDTKTKEMRCLVNLTIELMEYHRCAFYNDAVLITAVGTLPFRTRNQFDQSRKLGKAHQMVLTFCKGDPVKATAAIQKAIKVHDR